MLAGAETRRIARMVRAWGTLLFGGDGACLALLGLLWAGLGYALRLRSGTLTEQLSRAR